MRRLIVEISSRAFSKIDPENPLQKIRSIEVLHFLKVDHQEVALIAKVEFNEPDVSIEDVLRADAVDVHLLEHEREKGIYTYFIRARPSQSVHGGTDLGAGGGYFSLPFEVKDGKVKITYLGSAKQVRDFIKSFEELCDSVGARCRVISLTDARFSPHSPLSRLTEKQRRVFITAHNLGYYDIPKKIGLVQLAERLDIAYSTLDMLLRRAERRLMNHIMNES
jgi:predicted DNA binding protein